MDYIITLTAEEEKAMLSYVPDIQVAIAQMVYNRLRRYIDDICEQAIKDENHTILTLNEKKAVVKVLAAQGRIISQVKALPRSVKMQIVAAAKIKSAIEKNAEAEAEAIALAEAKLETEMEE